MKFCLYTATDSTKEKEGQLWKTKSDIHGWHGTRLTKEVTPAPIQHDVVTTKHGCPLTTAQMDCITSGWVSWVIHQSSHKASPSSGYCLSLLLAEWETHPELNNALSSKMQSCPAKPDHVRDASREHPILDMFWYWGLWLLARRSE